VLRRGLARLRDSMKPALRLSAVMEVPVVNVFTHGSIGVGEDGPTHHFQTIEEESHIVHGH
jgi:transketolase